MVPLMNVSAQALNITIQKTSGIEITRTLRFREGNKLRVDSVYIDTDTLKATYYFKGDFVSGNRDTLTLKLEQYTDRAEYTDGRRYSTVLPATKFALINKTGSDEVKIAIRNIQAIQTTQKSKVWGTAGLPLILLSIGTFFVSPAICYNYSNGSFNSELYQTLALSSTVGALTGILFGTLTPRETYDLRKNWRIKSISVK